MSDERPEGAWWAHNGEDPWAPQPPAQETGQDWPTGPVPRPEQPYPQQQPHQPQQQYGQPGQPQYGPQTGQRPGDPPFSTPYAPPYSLAGMPMAPQAAHPQPEVLTGDPGPRSRPRRLAPLLTALAVLIALVAGGVGGLVGHNLADDPSAPDFGGQSALPPTPKGTQERPQGSIPSVAAQLLQRVVSIQLEQGSGSGFVIRPDGYILTNNHVIAAAKQGGEVKVVFQDGKAFDATIVGADSSYDLAVIKVATSGLPTTTFGDSTAVVVGDPVIAIGSPLGLSGTVTTGIVSALDRPVTAGESGSGGRGQGGCGATDASYYSAIQTDAAINPGNSGGPLVNSRGEVIGVNSAISTLGGSMAGSQSGSIGLGFAIPSSQAKRIADEIIRTGKAVHPVIGVSLDCNYTASGARIGGNATTDPVASGGPADKAGLREGDVITAVDGKRVADSQELIVAIRAHAPGESVTVTYERGGGSRTAQITLGKSSAS